MNSEFLGCLGKRGAGKIIYFLLSLTGDYVGFDRGWCGCGLGLKGLFGLWGFVIWACGLITWTRLC